MPKRLLMLFAALLFATTSLEPAAAGQRTTGAGAVQTISIKGAPVAITLGAGGPWVLVGDGTGERLLRLDPATGELRATIDLSTVGTENGGAAAYGNAVWAATGAWLYRIDPVTPTVTVPVCQAQLKSAPVCAVEKCTTSRR